MPHFKPALFICVLFTFLGLNNEVHAQVDDNILTNAAFLKSNGIKLQLLNDTQLWSAFQGQIIGFVRNHSGTVSIKDPDIMKPTWSLVNAVLDGQLSLSTLSTDCPD